MIVLQANKELKQTFDRLIVTMKLPVKWSGNFVVIDDYMILQGEVRSLFFQFETRKVAANVIEMPIEGIMPQIVGTNVNLQNVINMLLYIFGKWGAIPGLKVEKDYVQLNQLFLSILRDLGVEAEYTKEHFYFYKDGMRITYEDVIQLAIDEAKKQLEGMTEREGGLWHRLIWTKKKTKFKHIDTDAKERMKERLGNNFYQVGYLCPVCGNKLHMVVYPEGKEFLIDTEEGGVLLARAFTCDKCLRFYTPRPDMMLQEGDLYVMDFTGDQDAYRDYLELLGQKGEKVSNCNFNKFADGRRNPDASKVEVKKETLEEICEKLPNYTEEELQKITRRMEEGFYPDASILRLERKVNAFVQKANNGETDDDRAEPDAGSSDKADNTADISGAVDMDDDLSDVVVEYIPGKKMADGNELRKSSGKIGELGVAGGNEPRKSSGKIGAGGVAGTYGRRPSLGKVGDLGVAGIAKTPVNIGDAEGYDESAEKKAGAANIHVKEHKGNLPDDGRMRTNTPKHTVSGAADTHDSKHDSDTAAHSNPPESPHNTGTLSHSASSGSMQHTGASRSSYSGKYGSKVISSGKFSDAERKKLTSDINNDPELSEAEKKDYLNGIEHKRVETKLVELESKVDTCEGGSYQSIKKVYDEIAATRDVPEETKRPFLHRLNGMMKDVGEKETKVTKAKKEAADRKEIESLIKQTRKTGREDYKELLKVIDESGFEPEAAEPYKKKIRERIRALDEKAIEALFSDVQLMSFDDGMELYQKIEAGDFLPELKSSALDKLEKRLSKIKADECELLQMKLRSDLEMSGLGDCRRHHFYPIRRVLMGQANDAETDVVENAMESYASGRDKFEYPIMVADSSKGGSGHEGMMITPDHIFYSKMLSAYAVDIDQIREVSSTSGFLSAKLNLHLKNGTKAKIPYGVNSDELPEWADVLNDFVHYLQEKPDSRDVEYLADEKHKEIICFRCGCSYKGGGKCPRCGYKNNNK